MFFKKKEAAVADPVMPEAPAPEEKAEWGEREKAIVYGYVLKAFRLWNLNRPESKIPESELTHLLMGLRMATTSATPEDALAAYEEFNNKKAGI